MAIFRGSGSSLTGSAIDPTEALLDSDFTVNGILVRTGSGVYSTTPDNTANWDTAYSWGDHATVGYYEPGGTDVAVDDGGTGASSASGARTNLGLGTAAEADIVGTVSQSGGTPTGAIIEQGSNSNGEYTKFADGTMIAWHVLNVPQGNSNRMSADWTHPAAFSSPANIQTTLLASGRTSWSNTKTVGSQIEIEPTASSGGTQRVVIYSDGLYTAGDETTDVYVEAKGRWF